MFMIMIELKKKRTTLMYDPEKLFARFQVNLILK